MRPLRKDKRGVRERFVKVFLITKNGRLQIKEFRTTAFYNYIYIYIDMYYIYIYRYVFLYIYIFIYIYTHVPIFHGCKLSGRLGSLQKVVYIFWDHPSYMDCLH